MDCCLALLKKPFLRHHMSVCEGSVGIPAIAFDVDEVVAGNSDDEICVDGG